MNYDKNGILIIDEFNLENFQWQNGYANKP